MAEIFRFVLLRPPGKAAELDISGTEWFAGTLTRARSATDPVAEARQAAEELISSSRAIHRIDSLHNGTRLHWLATRLSPHTPPDQVPALVSELMGAPAAELSNHPQLAEDWQRLVDNLLAARLLGRDGAVPAQRLESMLRMVWIISRLAVGDPALSTSVGLAAALRAPVTGAGGSLRSGRSATALAGGDRRARGAAARPSRADEVGVLKSALGILATAGADDLAAAEVSGLDEATPVPPPLRITPQAWQRVDPRARELLQEQGLDPTQRSLLWVVDELHRRIGQVEAERGRAILADGPVDLAPESGQLSPEIGPLEPESPGRPRLPFQVGVGDLLVVREQIQRYEAGEIAHVENALQGESRSRKHIRRRTVEETTTVEVETEHDEELNTQSTERFELQREASTVLKNETNFKIGAELTAKFGPAVQFKTSTEFASNEAKEQSTKTATTYAREVTEQAVSKITERRREEQVRRVVQEVEEHNEHQVDNSNGAGHVVGVYQWVDKVYQAQTYNYGRRMLYDVVVPEPAAFWLYSGTVRPGGTALRRPRDFTLRPDQLDDWNYLQYVQEYHVGGVEPPPPHYTLVTKTYGGNPVPGPEGELIEGSQDTPSVADHLELPAGYRAVAAHLMRLGQLWPTAGSVFTVFVGHHQAELPSGTIDPFRPAENYALVELGGEGASGTLPVLIRNTAYRHWTLAVWVVCQRVEQEAFRRWQLATHDAITQAYLQLKREYEEEQAALEARLLAEAGIRISGQNPLANRRIEHAELKRLAIAAVADEDFREFGAITDPEDGVPEPISDLAREQGQRIRFLEQAFEWENMTYTFYPYFWGARRRWLDRAFLEDVDPRFADFLRAGAARVVVPVRPGYEADLAYFQQTGRLWSGGGEPSIDDERYVNIIDELRERDQADADELPEGQPWEIRLPTTLVRLRPDGSLPVWQQDEDGSWTTPDPWGPGQHVPPGLDQPGSDQPGSGQPGSPEQLGPANPGGPNLASAPTLVVEQPRA